MPGMNSKHAALRVLVSVLSLSGGKNLPLLYNPFFRPQSVGFDPPSVSSMVSASVPLSVGELRASRGKRAASILAWLPGSPQPSHYCWLTSRE